MKRALALVPVLAVLTLALTACGAPSHGIIHDKQYNPAYYYNMCIAQPKGGCIYVPEYEPASWEFDLYASKDDHGWVDVDETTYNRYGVGDYYDSKAATRG